VVSVTFNTIVCVKQVPDPEFFQDIKVDPATNTINRKDIPAILNPLDKNALEEALRLREEHGGGTAAISMGPPDAEEILREALAMGVDKAFLISDKACAGADTLATAYVLSMAIKKTGTPDVVFCGNETVDGGTGQIGPQLAEFLGIPHVTYVRRIHVVGEGTMKVERAIERGYMIVEAQLPVVLAVDRDINKPRYLTPINILDAESKDITVWQCEDIAAEKSCVGLSGSPTCISSVFKPQFERDKEILRGKPDTASQELVARLRKRGAV
jgi:electron transfer flavoprotein beta subunit